MGKALLIGAVGFFLIAIATHDFGHTKPLISWRFDVTWAPEKPAKVSRATSSEADSPTFGPFGAPASPRDFKD
jgi:hypothetical protein